MKWVDASESKPSSTAWYVTARRERDWRFTQVEDGATFTLGRLNYPGGEFPSNAEVWLEIPPPPWLQSSATEPEPEPVSVPATLPSIERVCDRCGLSFGAGKHLMMDGINYHEFEVDHD